MCSFGVVEWAIDDYWPPNDDDGGDADGVAVACI